MGTVSTVGVQRVWVVIASLAGWLGLLAWGVLGIVQEVRVLPSIWPHIAPPPAPPPTRGAIRAADGTPLAISLPTGERLYPLGASAGQVIGYTERFRDRTQNRVVYGAGLEGVERFAENKLAAGQDVYLTLDPVVQALAERALWAGVAAAEAEWGSVVVMETQTGRLLAVANAPAFDPATKRGQPGNDPRLLNYAFRYLIEPGSTLKVITAAALLEEGKATLETRVEAPMQRKVADAVIRDVVRHPETLTLAEVLAYSSNVGISTLAEALEPETLYRYFERLHLTDPDLLTPLYVERPLVNGPESWGPVEFANATFGQGLAITPLHLAAAFNAIANDGVFVRPSLFEPAGAPQTARVFQPEVARALREVLSAYNAPLARLEGYVLGGKTGTAQVAVDGRYSREVFTALYAGFVPADRPRATVVVVLYHPRTSIYGSRVAAPIYRALAEGLLAYWGIPPERGKLVNGE